MKVYRCFPLMFNCLLAAYCIKFHMCSFCVKGVERFKQALEISPESVSARYGLASGLLGLAKAWINLGAFRWGASLLEVNCFLKFLKIYLPYNIKRRTLQIGCRKHLRLQKQVHIWLRICHVFGSYMVIFR